MYMFNVNNNKILKIYAMKKLLVILTVCCIVSGVASGHDNGREKRKAREKAKSEEVQKLFESRSLQFLAQSAQPMGGGIIHLTSDYSLDIDNGMITSYLPFYGVAYTAEYGEREGGIKFSETEKVSEWKVTRKGYRVRIDVKAPKDLYHLNLTFSSLGYAMLDVSCQNRQSISYTGVVQPIPVKK